MEREAKANVVASVWGADFVQFLAALAVLTWSIWKNRMNTTVSYKTTEAKQLAWQGIEENLPPNRCDDLCLCFSLHPSSMCVQKGLGGGGEGMYTLIVFFLPNHVL